MLFHSSIRRELARSFGATLVVLVTVVMTLMLVRTLGQASRGAVNPSEILMVLGYTVLGFLPAILTLSLFISLVGSLTRMYQDSEMVIWFTAGRGLGGFLGPLFHFAWPILLTVAVMSLLVWPWSNQQVRDLRDRYERRGDLERVTPGQFQESSRGNRVFFIDKESPDSKSGTNVFISSTDKDRKSVTSARKGRISEVGDARILLLENGQRLESNATDSTLKLSEFEEYGVVVGETVQAAQEPQTRAKSTLTLLMEPTRLHLGELSWRIGLALAAINFVTLAIALAGANPRGGRSGSFVFSLFAFVVYYNLINLGQNWIANGRFPFLGYVIALHTGVMVLSLLWLVKRNGNWAVPGWRRPRKVRA
ncbi:MAG: LPS export ABC transporter permease LptF [Burkholderiales bacterium]|nr:LPS export ABC transporter permease LptF [Burkholderiales bacterium]